MSSSEAPGIEGIHELTPLQKGILFHVAATRDPGLYLAQLAWRIDGNLDTTAFRDAWQLLMDRHAILRTSVIWQELEEPLQVVQSGLPLPWRELDWQGLDAGEWHGRMEVLLREQREAGFDLALAPLMELTLVRLGAHSHLFVWCHHHVILDGWSRDVLLHELFACYGALREGRAPELEDPRPFSSYVEWLRGRDRAEAERFWRGRLGSLSGPTLLPGVRPQNSPPAVAAAREQRILLSSPATAELQAVARQHRLTFYTLLASAWGLLLCRATGQREVVFGSASSGRSAPLPGIESMVGLLLTTLPLRVAAPPGTVALLPWLQERMADLLDLQFREGDPLPDIQRWSGVPAGTPLFESILVFESFARGGGEPPAGLSLKTVDPGVPERNNYPLSLVAIPGPRLHLRLRYDPTRVEDAAMARLALQLETLLEAMPGAAGRLLDEIPWLTAAQLQQVCREWNDTDRDFSADPDTLHGRIEEQARRTPDVVAVRFRGVDLSYRELEQRASRLARRLASTGVGAETTVALCAERSHELMVALLAILKAGGAWVPLDPEYPRERLAYMLEDSGSPVLLIQRRLTDRVPMAGRRVLLLDEQEDGEEGTPAPAGRVDAGQLAYVIYTSGSTGRPKGTMNTHRAIVNRLLWMQEAYGLGLGDRVLQKTPFSFDVSVWELFWPLLAGARLVMAEPSGHQDSAYLARTIAEEGITTIHFVPSMLRLFLSEPDLSGCSCLSLVVCSGEALTPDLQLRASERLEAELHNLYGPTEAAVDVTAWACRGEPGDSVPIGRPIANLQIHLLDSNLRPVPPGVPAELYIGGMGLARGYLGQPTQTAAGFVPNPSSEKPGARLYRTGDLAVWREDGALGFLGRADFQIKVRGLRIEPGEIEAALGEHPGVHQAVVAVLEAAPGDQRLVAWLVTGGEPLPAARELRLFLQERVPAYMVPSAFLRLESLPLTPSGKLDRRALPSPEVRTGTTAYLPPRTPAEQRLCSLWADLLGVDRVGIDDDFFELGGHSLLAMKMVVRLREALDIDLPLAQVFQAPTVRRLAETLARLQGSGERGLLPSLVPDPIRLHEPFPLTEVQQAYWVGRTEGLELGNVSAQSYLELEADSLDLGRFESALQRLIDRHPMLRAVVMQDATQRILPEVPPYRIEVLDLRGLPAAETEHALAAVRERMAHQVLPADRWPLFEMRATLLDSGRVRLHVSLDALIRDASSDRILLGELEALYRDPDAALPALELSFRDFVLAQLALREGELYRRSREYWQRQLDDLPPAPDLPLAVSPSSLRQPRFSSRTGELAAPAWTLLQERAARASLTPSGVLLAAYADVLAVWSRSTRFTLNLTLVDRLPLHPQVDRIVGELTAVTLLSVDAGEAAAFEERARTLQARLWENLDHRFFSGIAVLREIARRHGRAAAAMPVIFTSTLGLGSADGKDGAREADFASRLVYSGLQTPQVWLDHVVVERGGRLVWTWSTVDGLFPPGLIGDLFEVYGRLLERLAGTEEAWQQGLEALVPPGQLAVRAMVNATAAPLPAGLLHEPFLGQAEARPGAAAVAAPGRTLSYGELRLRSNGIARELRRRGVNPFRPVAIVMEKGWEQVVAVLAVLEAGAPYVPIDPDLPEERIVHLFAVTGADLALTQSWTGSRLGWPPGVSTLAVDLAPKPAEAEPLNPLQKPDDLAYLIFTSGSTGVPKGVMIEHRAALNTVVDVNRRFSVSAADRIFALSRLSFDLSVYDVFGTLAAGGCIVLPSASGVRDPGHWAERLADEGVTLWNSVPALLEMLIDWVPSRSGGAPGSLRLAMLSGDWIPVTLPGRIRRLAPACQVFSLGGATEAAIWSIVHPAEEVDPEWMSIPYGRPMDNQRFHVLDDALRPRPDWVAGQIYIGGVGLARGYWQDEEKTAASFVLHPRTGERLYRTGDLGRYRPGGDIELLGREDTQVKVQGYRIELGEIEAALLQHPRVAGGVVQALGERGNRRLAGYVVDGPGGAAADAELRSFLASRLPAYMIPGTFVHLSALPLSANGKVDRRSLPAPETLRDAPTMSAPASATAARVAALMAEVLGVERVDPVANLLELGASSVDLVLLANRLLLELGSRPPMEELFALAVDGGLAAWYEGRSGAAPPPPVVRTVPEDAHLPFPLTEIQQSYWLGSTGVFELGNASAHYYQENDFPLSELLEAMGAGSVREEEAYRLVVDRVRLAWDRLIGRHPMLRAVVLADGRQQILEKVPAFLLPVLDLRGLGEEPVRTACAAMRDEMVHRGPRVDRWPLFEVIATLLAGARVRFHFSVSLMVCDALSLGLLFRDLLELVRTPGAELPPLHLTFRDYVQALAASESTPAYARALEYWRARLGGLPGPPDLPLARQPAQVSSPRFVRRSGGLAPGPWARLQARARSAGLTANSVLCAAYAHVLADWSRHRRFTLNLLFFNRLPVHPQVGEVIGNFSATLLLEVDLSERRVFAEEVRRLQARLWQDIEHGAVTGVRVLRELHRKQGGNARVLMPVVFASTLDLWSRQTASTEGDSNGEARPADYSGMQTPQVWLDHQVTERAGGLAFNWDAVEDLFPAGLVAGMFGAYCGLLESLSEEDTDWQLPIPPLLPAEQRARRDAVNDTVAPRSEALLHALVYEQALREPDRPAVIAPGHSLSHGELQQRSGTLARRLRELGARPGRLVAVVMEKGWEQVVAVLAILEAGGAYLPIDAALPPDRLGYLLEHGEVQLILTQPWLAGQIPWPPDATVLTVSREEPVFTEALPPAKNPGDLAYVIYTSGSTGLPKGVMIAHRGAVNTVLDVNRRLAVGPEDRVLALSSLGFDLSVYDVFGLLAAGGAVVLPKADDMREPGRWAAALRESRVTIWNTVPALMEMLVDHLEARETPLPESLRAVMLSGDWIPVTLPGRIRALASGRGIEVLSLGGATEASIWSIRYPIEEVEAAWQSIPYGRPMDNQTFHVLDEALQPRPDWVPGGLYIGGLGLAEGYWRDEDKTRTAFFVHPTMGERLYRTGDLGRYLPSGDIEFLGREDFQVKIQGYRIELGEIEAALLQHPQVRAAVVLAVGEMRGAKRLAAYVVADPAPPAAELQAFLRGRLPEYMVPLAYVSLEALPLTANGKIDRNALLREEPAELVRRPSAAAAPRDGLELELVRIWEEVLDRSPVGVTDGFFDMGGDSLLAVRLMARIERRLGRELPLSALLSGGTVEGLATRLRLDGSGTPPSPLVEIRGGGEAAPLFFVHPVGGSVLCYLDLSRRLGPGRPFYGLQAVDNGAIDLPMEEPLEEMAARYLREVRRVAPQGPYRLGGWSMGGVVAFEMARQLHEQGEEVAGLALVDVTVPAAGNSVPLPDEATLLSWFTRDLGKLAGLDLEVTAEALRELSPAERLARVALAAREAGILPPGAGVEQIERYARVFQRNYRTLLAYLPRPYDGPVSFLRAFDSPPEISVSWRSCAHGEFREAVLPGDHYGLIRPPAVDELARYLEETP